MLWSVQAVQGSVVICHSTKHERHLQRPRLTTNNTDWLEFANSTVVWPYGLGTRAPVRNETRYRPGSREDAAYTQLIYQLA